MKIYRVTYDDQPDWGLLAISLVDFPAVEKNFLKFCEEPKRQQVRLKADDEQHVITGVALLADTPIYRRNKELGEYYIVFEKDTIRQLVEKYSKDGLLNVIDLQHDRDTYSTSQCVMIESYFIDKERGIVPEEFKDVTDGSWVVSFKVTDDDLWKQIKESDGGEGGLNGFSVEVVSGLERMKAQHRMAAEEPIGDCEALAEALGLEKKKIDFRVSTSDVKAAMREEVQVDIELTDGGKVVRGQMKDLGRRGGADVVSVYLPDKEVWEVLKLDDIAAVKLTDVPLAAWKYDVPSYEDIVADDDIVITDSREANDENLKAAIEGRFFAMIYYDDESGEGCTNARQVQVVAAGYHTGTGNKCFRAYEWFGDTHTEVPAWKMFLTKRCRSFRLMTEADKWTSVPPLYHMNDSQMETILWQVDDSFIPTTV